MTQALHTALLWYFFSRTHKLLSQEQDLQDDMRPQPVRPREESMDGKAGSQAHSHQLRS